MGFIPSLLTAEIETIKLKQLKLHCSRHILLKFGMQFRAIVISPHYQRYTRLHTE